MKQISKKAFTLIELMIVVVILWVLMSTILPKLTWAQARARDAWRVADLWNIANALTTYYDDYWVFPSASSWSWECISTTSSWWTAIKSYMQWEVIPKDMSVKNDNLWCIWQYRYKSLTKDGITDNAFVLCANVETFHKANSWSWSTIPAKSNYSDVSDLLDLSDNLKAETTDAKDSVYCLLRP